MSPAGPKPLSYGAAVGIYRVAKTLGKQAHIVLNDITVSMQPMVELFKNNDDYDHDMIITGIYCKISETISQVEDA